MWVIESFTGWVRSIDGLLSSIDRPTTAYVNIDEARVRGIEVTLNLSLTLTLRLTTSGTLTDSEQIIGGNAGHALNDMPKEQAPASLNGGPNTRLSACACAIYRAKEAVTEAQISGTNVFAASFPTVDNGGTYRICPEFSLHRGIQTPLQQAARLQRLGIRH